MPLAIANQQGDPSLREAAEAVTQGVRVVTQGVGGPGMLSQLDRLSRKIRPGMSLEADLGVPIFHKSRPGNSRQWGE